MVAKQESSRLQVWHLAWSPGYSKEKKNQSAVNAHSLSRFLFVLCIYIHVCAYICRKCLEEYGAAGWPGNPPHCICPKHLCNVTCFQTSTMDELTKQEPCWLWLSYLELWIWLSYLELWSFFLLFLKLHATQIRRLPCLNRKYGGRKSKQHLQRAKLCGRASWSAPLRTPTQPLPSTGSGD